MEMLTHFGVKMGRAKDKSLVMNYRWLWIIGGYELSARILPEHIRDGDELRPSPWHILVS